MILGVGLLHVSIIDVVACYRIGVHDDKMTGFRLIM